MPIARHTGFACDPACSIEATVSLLDGKWKSIVLFNLLGETVRFNDLRRRIPNVTQRVLTSQLRELERDGLIVRTVYAQVPPKVEYRISPLGRSLEPILGALKAWGDAHLDLFERRPKPDPEPRETLPVYASSPGRSM